MIMMMMNDENTNKKYPQPFPLCFIIFIEGYKTWSMTSHSPRAAEQTQSLDTQ